MNSNYDPPYLFNDVQSPDSFQFQKSQDSFEIASLSDKSFILSDSFNQAYNDVFNTSKMNDDFIEPDEGHSDSNIFTINNIKSIEEGNIITESVKIIIGSTKKKNEKEEEKYNFFTEGIGIPKTLEKLGLKVVVNSNKYSLCEFKEKKFECKEMIKGS